MRLLLAACFGVFGDKEGTARHLPALSTDTSPPSHVIHVITVLGVQGASRRANIKQFFNKQQQPYVFEPAYVTSPIIPRTLASGCWDMATTRKHNPANKKATKIAEISAALVLSHSRLYTRLLQGDMPFMIIAEDDVRLVDGIRSHIKHVLKNLPEAFDVVKLEHCNSKPMVYHYTAVSIHHGQGGPCTALYIISRAGASLLLRTNPPLQPCWAIDGSMDVRHRDLYTGDLSRRKLQIYHSDPSLGWQDRAFPSNPSLNF